MFWDYDAGKIFSRFSDVSWNISSEVLRLLLRLGCPRFYCRNRDELRAALDAGVPPHRVVFAPASSPAVASHVKFAHSAGVAALAFRNGNDLAKISARAPGARSHNLSL